MTIIWALVIVALSQVQAGEPKSFDHSYTVYARFLQKHTSDGLIGYASIKRERALLDSAVASITTVSAEELQSFTREQRIAYWINAYNLLTLKLVVSQYPIESIMQLAEPGYETEFDIAGQKLTLNEIEQKLLWEDFNEPRIMCALSRASMSGPLLWDRPYTADSLRTQLVACSQRFAGDTTRNRLDIATKRLQLCKLFEWYHQLFHEQYSVATQVFHLKPPKRGVTNFVITHWADSLRAKVEPIRLRVSFLDYDWSLNDTAQ